VVARAQTLAGIDRHGGLPHQRKSRHILCGKGGEFASNRLEDQEMLMLALHLLQVSLVYVKTLMI
jgi:TnpA family transposase